MNDWLRYEEQTKLLDRHESPKLSARQFQAILDGLPAAAYTCDREGLITYYNARAVEAWGRTPKLLDPADRYCGASKLYAPDGTTIVHSECWMALAIRENRPFLGREIVVERPCGNRSTVLAHANPLFDESGTLIGAVNVLVDITERMQIEEARRQAEEALKSSEERFREVITTIDEVFWLTKPDSGEVVYVSPAYERIWGRSCASLYADPLSWTRAVHRDDRDRVIASVRSQSVTGSYQEEYRIIRPDRTVRWIRDRGFPVRDARGGIVRLCGVAEDITDQKLLQDQLLQAQKMEVIGLLVGGVAHDFNNLLTVINCLSELILRQLPEDEPHRGLLAEIKKAGERAASLTRQLLAFSRKQVLAPEVFDLNSLVQETENMLRRLIGEDIELVSVQAPNLYPVKADPGQIEQILMNLAVNARDAMPYGGKLTIETANVKLERFSAGICSEITPGAYVMLAMTDTGCGMDKATQARIFEPFFTTKGPGKGTGLGLATVYGIVKQSGGYIYLYSEPGQGTTFKVYLPQVNQTPETMRPSSPSSQSYHGGETVLLIEDDDNVRAVTLRALQAWGYSVIEARSADDALLAVEQCAGPIHLILTDVVLPTMSGPALAERIAHFHSQTKVLFVSGYTDDAIVRSGLLSGEKNFLQKPFSPRALVRKVREVLDARCSG